jgi:hypothetical protein
LNYCLLQPYCEISIFGADHVDSLRRKSESSA